MPQTEQLLLPPQNLTFTSKINNSSKGSPDRAASPGFSRNDDIRCSTGSMKGKNVASSNIKDTSSIGASSSRGGSQNFDETDSSAAAPTSVHNLIKGFQAKMVNGAQKSLPSQTSNQDLNYKTPGYVVEPVQLERKSSKRKLSIRQKKNKMTADDARFSILQSLGMSAYSGNDNRKSNKNFAYFDVQSLFFKLEVVSSFEEGGAYIKKLTGASAASARNNQGSIKSDQSVTEFGKTVERVESVLDDGDNNGNDLLLNCPFFRNEISHPINKANSDDHIKDLGSIKDVRNIKDVTKLISMFNRNLVFDKFSSNYDKKRNFRKRELLYSSNDILLEELKDDSSFFTWDEPNVSEPQIFEFEHIDRGAMYYREFFSEQEHTNLFGIDKNYGPIAISIVRELLTQMVLGHDVGSEKNTKNKYQYRIILRTSDLQALRISVLENSIPSSSRHNSSRPLPLKDILEYCFPEIQISCLRYSLPDVKINEHLIKLDEQELSLKHKVGLLYCRANQTTEEEMYNNEHAGSEFLEFCSIIGDTVALKGFQGYRAQLDNANDSTGQHSLYTNFHGREIMFHVSTELPFTPNDKQQLLRKRHIGNDIVTVIFQEPGSKPFTPQMIRSHFQHVFVIVKVENPHTEFTKYEVAVSRSMDVPAFGPPIPQEKFSKNATFREFLLCKLINGENAAHKSDKFTHMHKRTRYQYLKELATNKVSTQTLEPPNKFGFPFSKKKEKTHPPVFPELWLQGGFIWSIKFDFDGDGMVVSCFLSISAKSIVFVDHENKSILLTIPCKSVLGWKPTSHTLKLFYEDGKLAFFTLSGDDINELPYIINRLKAVTPGCETQDLTLRRNNDGQLGFHVYYQGLVADVEPYALAWQAGLRKGSRLLEINNLVVVNMAHEKMIQMLKRPGAVRIVVLPPASDGQPRNSYRSVKMRRFSSMTSVYSMSVFADTDATSTSSKECMTTASSESPMITSKLEVQTKPRSLSVEINSARDQPRSSIDSTSSDSSNNEPYPPKTHDSIIMSRSTSDIALKSAVTFTSIQPKLPPKNVPLVSCNKLTSGSLSIEQDLDDIETKLTDTRKSIDAKFYRSLANSPSPFFRQKQNLGASNDFIHEDVFHQVSEEVSESIVQRNNLSVSEKRLNRSSLEHAFENPRELPDRELSDNSGIAVVDVPFSFKVPQSIISEQDPLLRRRWSVNDNHRIEPENHSDSKSMSVERLNDKDSVTLLVKTKVCDVSDIVIERNEINRESIFKTKSLPQKLVIENQSLQDNQISIEAPKTVVSLYLNDNKTNLSSSEQLFKLNDGVKSKLIHNTTNHDSSDETFSKIDVSFKSPFSLDEKKKKRLLSKHRTRNCEPPESDSSEDIETKQRYIKSVKRPYDEKNVYKSEAEENFEAAISEFQKSFSSMQQVVAAKKYDTINNSSINPPEIPLRMSQPITLVKHRLSQLKDSSENHQSDSKEKRSVSVPSKMRAEIKVSLTSLRPWTPPQPKLQPSNVIKDNINQKLGKEGLESYVKDKQLSIAESGLTSTNVTIHSDNRLDGIRSLPCRGIKRLYSVPDRIKSQSVSSMPLSVKGLNLATIDKQNFCGPCSNEDLRVMLTVMENEIEQVREEREREREEAEKEREKEKEERERLSIELKKSQEENKRLLEQSRQAVSHLQKFTSLFLDSSPEALDKLRQRYSES
ncbi:uncharacterized protein LOC100209333 isoform X2 [Hydra vulgaris]|uniref:Uncharacterized protein LOC100209333 isoform X2 n=1 Tax=Hydra vulgaris TaxID=6087 RepID=A0ABM4C0M5_HYDVU